MPTPTPLIWLLLQAGGSASPPAWHYEGNFGGVEVKARSSPGTSIEEISATAALPGSAAEYRAVILDLASYPKFMPYVKEAQIVRRDPDGTEVTYIRHEFPWPISPRDDVARHAFEHDLDADGKGAFVEHWFAFPDFMPPRPGVIRLQKDEGVWRVTAFGPKITSVELSFLVDPGGVLPGWVHNMANKQGLPATFKALRDEVERRRQATAAKGP